MGYHLVDDEGTPGRHVDIIKDGILLDQQTSREIAPLLGKTASSNMLASFADDIPLVRMTNFCLAPGSGSLDDLIKDTEHGYYIDYTKTWSIDDNRNNFQFTTEIGYKIENGTITGIVKEPTYFGITPEFWAACDRVCGPEEWQFHGTFHCGKGEPGQSMHLSHGVAPARFKNIVCNVKA
jgi:TldD protein